jgi:probable HAF family extracellular repeat protein
MSNAQDINDKGTIVGWSNNTINSNSFSRRAVVWKNGTISDLNNLIPPNSGCELYTAQVINNRTYATVTCDRFAREQRSGALTAALVKSVRV